MSSARFRYLLDPLFLVCVALYAINVLLIRNRIDVHFLKAHFDDLLLIPCALPPVLGIQRLLRLRTHDYPPTFLEVAGHLVVWSIMAEFLGPRLHLNYRDPLDFVAYAAGALVAWLIWQKSRTPPRRR